MNMSKAAKDIEQKATGRGLGLLVRMHAAQLREIDGWISITGEPLSRPEALRRLAAMALESMKYRPRREETAA